MSNPLIIIPARMQSQRLPNKPLVDIAGKPMVVRMMECANATHIGNVVVATDHQDIVDVVAQEGGKAILTDPDLPSGSDRVYCATSQLDPEGKYDIIINLQGDMPTCDPHIIGQAVDILNEQPAYDIATLVAPISDDSERNNPAVVKAVVSWQTERIGKALYFTRATAPSSGPLWHHVGLYAYRRGALKKFVELPPSPLEQQEKLEQLRALEANMHIGIGKVNVAPLGVDTPETLEQVRVQFKEL